MTLKPQLMIFEFFTSFCYTNRNLNHKTLEQCFLKELKTTCKAASESEVKQQKQPEMHYGPVIH